MTNTPSTGRFLWPPQPAEVQPPPASQDPQPFDRPPHPCQPECLARWPGRFAQWVDEIEKTWLSRVVDPLSQRLAAADWRPDPPEAYCPRCGTSAGPHEADDTGCPWCHPKRLPWSRAVRLAPYTGALRDTILEVKFSRWRRLGDDLGRLLGRSLAAALDRSGIDPVRAVLVPVPTSWRSRLARGIDHTLVIARGVARETGIPIVRALSRAHRPSQRAVPRSSRAANVAGAFRPTGRLPELAGQTVILLDDVRTTGATLAAASKAIRRAFKGQERGPGAVWTAVLGVTPEPGRRARPDSGGTAGASTPDRVAEGDPSDSLS